MKRAVFIIILFSVFSAFAELRPAKRFVEFGVSGYAGASENLMGVNSLMQKELVLDLPEIYSKMGKDGFVLTAEAAPEFHLDFSFCKFGIGLHSGLEVSGRFNISKDLFGILAEGISAGQTKEIEMNAWMQAFVTASVPFYFRIQRFKIHITPTYFMPLFYAPAVSMKGTVAHRNDGTTSIKVNAPISLYTVQKFDGIISGGKLSMDFLSNIDILKTATSALSSGGLDIGVLIEYPFSKSFDLGGYLNFPVLPARLKSGMTSTLSASIEMPSVLDMAFNSASIESSYSFSDPQYVEETYNVNRPLRFGAEISYHPFKKWITLSARGGLAMRNPFGKDFSAKSIYPEYDLGAEFVIFYFLGLGLHTSYTDKIFAHTFQLILNARVLELDVAVALCNSRFVDSFKLEGARAMVGFKLGW